MMKLVINKQRLSQGLLLALLVALVAFPLVITDPFNLSVLTEAGAMCIMTLGFIMVFRSGQLSLGQAGIAAIGAYTGALLSVNCGLSFWFALLAGGLSGALISMLIGMVVLRLGGMYFAIVTLALGQIVTIIIQNWAQVTGGVKGVIIPQPLIELGSLTIDFSANKIWYYYLVVLLVILTALVLWRITKCTLGLFAGCVALNPTLSEHLGMHLMKYRVIMFTIAGFFTGIGGVFYSFYNEWISPLQFTADLSNALLIMAIIGGLWSPIAGPIIGATVITYFGTMMQVSLAGLRPLVFGLAVILLLRSWPGGLVDLWYKFPAWVKSLLRKKQAAT